MKKSYIAYAIIISFVVSCSKKEKQTSPAPNILIEKRDLYLALQPSVLNEYGYAHAKCDSLGFSALCKASTTSTNDGCKAADLYRSEDNGRWYRSPEKDCFDKGESKSDFSKDMALMLFIYFYKSKDLSGLSRFKSYVEANNYVMGRPTDNAEGLSRVVMSPGLIATMKRLHAHLSNEPVPDIEEPEESETQTALPVINEGFRAHLDVLKIWLDAKLKGKLDSVSQYVMQKQVERQPRNAIFQAVYHSFKDGDQSKVIEILSDESLFPNDRLPSSKERCEEYIFQRDYGNDWQPCINDENEIHDGVDFLMAGMLAGFW